MRYKKLGWTEVEVSEICLGTSNLWKDGSFLIEKALELGINFFDTADVYGCGESEKILGGVLKGKRGKVVIISKVGMEPKTWVPKSSELHFIESCDKSLKRLKTDYIDLYLVHCFSNPEALVWMRKLKDKGKIRNFGVSNYNSNQLQMSPFWTECSAIQTRINYLQQSEYYDIKGICESNNITILAYSPFCKGIMTGKFKGTEIFKEGDDRYKDHMYEGNEFNRNIDLVNNFLSSNKKEGESKVQTVLRWFFEKGIIPVVGVRNVEQELSNAKAS